MQNSPEGSTRPDQEAPQNVWVVFEELDRRIIGLPEHHPNIIVAPFRRPERGIFFTSAEYDLMVDSLPHTLTAMTYPGHRLPILYQLYIPVWRYRINPGQEQYTNPIVRVLINDFLSIHRADIPPHLTLGVYPDQVCDAVLAKTSGKILSKNDINEELEHMFTSMESGGKIARAWSEWIQHPMRKVLGISVKSI